jgi:hypothetical protein
MSDDRLGIDAKLDNLGILITRENREQERTVLMILHGLTSIISVIATNVKTIEDTSAEHKANIEAQQKVIDEHDELVIKGKTSWYWLSTIVGILGVGFVSLFSYGYFMIADLRDTVRTQQAIEDYVNKGQTNAVTSNNTEIINHTNDIDAMQKELDDIKKLKSIKASK